MLALGSYRKKLIEVALPLEAINVASAREKSIRHGHPSTLHLWWARMAAAALAAAAAAAETARAAQDRRVERREEEMEAAEQAARQRAAAEAVRQAEEAARAAALAQAERLREIAEGRDQATSDTTSPPAAEPPEALSPIAPLIIVGVLLSIVVFIVDLLFVAAEMVLAGPASTGNALAILLSLIIVAEGLFLTNLDIAYWVYAYRLTGASPSEDVPFDLTPGDWGLGHND